MAWLRDVKRPIHSENRRCDVETLSWDLVLRRRFVAWDMAFTNEEIVSPERFQ